MVEANRISGSQRQVRHILSLSGGKDSTALAIFMRDKSKYGVHFL